MKICPKCGGENRETAINCFLCNSDIRNAKGMPDSYYNDLADVKRQNEKNAMRTKYLKIIIPVYFVLYIGLFTGVLCYSSISKNWTTTCFVVLPLIGYLIVHNADKILKLIIYDHADHNLWAMEKVMFDDYPEIPIIEVIFLGIGYLVFLFALGLMGYWMFFS